jgi:DNA-binding beta-propeller fold protein YncE
MFPTSPQGKDRSGSWQDRKCTPWTRVLGSHGRRHPWEWTYFKDQGVEVGHRLVWVSTVSRLSRLNPATGEPLRPIPPREGFEWGDVAAGVGSVWIAERPGSVVRLDPRTGRVIDRIDVPGTPDDIAAGEGAVWVADKLASTVFRIDPKKNQVVSEFPVGGSLDEIAVGQGAVWILDSTAGTLASIRPDTEEIRGPFPVGSDPTGLDVGLGSVWVAGGREGIVTWVNPNTLAQVLIAVGAPVSEIAVDEGEGVVWVTVS